MSTVSEDGLGMCDYCYSSHPDDQVIGIVAVGWYDGSPLVKGYCQRCKAEAMCTRDDEAHAQLVQNLGQ